MELYDKHKISQLKQMLTRNILLKKQRNKSKDFILTLNIIYLYLIRLFNTKCWSRYLFLQFNFFTI